MHDLNPSELRRYARQMILPEIGSAGQQRLKTASVLLVGAGGLGSPVALYLAAAGVGHLTIVDPDLVDESNLHRQILHGISTLGVPKTDSAANRLRDLNPDLSLTLHKVRFAPGNALQLARGHHLIIDGCDNFPTRFLTNDTGFLLDIPVVTGAIFRFEGQVTVLAPRKGGPCLRCFLPAMPPPEAVPSCAEAGVLGVLPGIIGCLQANEATKLLLGVGEPLIDRMLRFDALTATTREVRLKRDPGCALCGNRPTILLPDNAETRASVACAAAVDHSRELDASALDARLAAGFSGLLVDVREPFEHAIAAIPGSTLVPLGHLPAACADWPRDLELLVYCKAGVRSQRALRILEQAGFQKVSHLAGGIDAWLEAR